MKSGVHWLFFSFFQAGGQLTSFSSMSHTNMSSGCVTQGGRRKHLLYDWSTSDWKRAGPGRADVRTAHLYSFLLNTGWRNVDVLPGQREDKRVEDVNEKEVNEGSETASDIASVSDGRKERLVLWHYAARQSWELRSIWTAAVFSNSFVRSVYSYFRLLFSTRRSCAMAKFIILSFVILTNHWVVLNFDRAGNQLFFWRLVGLDLKPFSFSLKSNNQLILFWYKSD